MAERIRWGVLGNATIARKCVIPAIARSKNGALRALGTRSLEKSGALAKRYGIERLVEGYDAVLADPAVDAVYIPLPNHLHRPWTLKALAAGKHVLCEKPLALNAEEAHAMAGQAAASGRLLMEAFMYRFHPRSRAVKALASEGGLGRLRSVRAAFCYVIDEALMESAGNFRLQPETGGGALLDVGCYGVSAARWLLSAEPAAVQAQAVFRHGVDVHTVGTLRFADGALASIEAGFTSTLQQTFSVAGDEAAVELPHNAFIPWDAEALYTLRRKDEETGETRRLPGADEYRLMVEHFADAALGRVGLDYRPQDSIANMRALDALAEAARTGRTVRLLEPR
jgi:predicted dehydrogenase